MGLRAGLGWILVALVVNGLIFGLGWNDMADKVGMVEPWWAPPGWVIGVVWLVLFGCMGAAQGRLRLAGRWEHWLVVGLLVGCLAYPFYTSGLQVGPVAQVGTGVTLLVATAVVGRVQRVDARAAWLLVPLCLWLGFAFVLIGEVRG